MDNKPVYKRETNKRIKKFQDRLDRHGIDGALIVDKVCLYYFTATDQDSHLWIPASGRPLLMVRKSMERALKDTAVEQIMPLKSLSQLPDYIKTHTGHEPEKIGLELDIIPVNTYHIYRRLFPQQEMVDISSLIRQVRMVKSPYEISLIKKAANIADRLKQLIPQFIAESGTETELALRAEGFLRKEGHPGLSRTRTFNMETIYGHIMAGPGGAFPSNSPGPTGGYGLGPWFSQGAGRGKMNPHEPIIVDYTACVEGYLSDQARIFSIGKLPDKFHHAHNIMLKVQEALANEGKPGIKASELYALAMKIVEEAGLSDGFMGIPQPVRFVGHGVGLELDELPVIGKNSDIIMKKGMFIALEPKYIFPGEGVVGIENTFVISENGMERLNRFPDEIVILP